MANEISVTAKLQIVKGNLSNTNSTSSFSLDQDGDGLVSGVQNIGTSAEAIDLGDVGTLGYAYFRNVGDTNNVQIGQDISGGGFEEFMLLEPGEVALCRLDLATGGVLQAKAISAATELQYTILED
jgi:hypothetical protein